MSEILPPIRSFIGKRLYLRPNERSDTHRIRLWLNDPVVSKFLNYHRLVDEKAQEDQYERRDRSNTPKDLFLAIVLSEGNQHIGQIGLHDIDYVHGHAVTGMVIGGAEHWGKGYAGEAKDLLLDHAFNGLRLHRVTSLVFATNTQSIKQLEKTGYVHEGTLRQQVFRAGKFHDERVYGILAEEWRERRILSPAL